MHVRIQYNKGNEIAFKKYPKVQDNRHYTGK